jgi:hypothetical protein
VSFKGTVVRGPMAADVFEKNFTRIYNGLFRDPRISFKAKGIFGLISTHREGFGVSLESIAACSTDGIAGVRTGLLELIEFQYLQRDRDRNEKGQLGKSVYFITDMPNGLIILMNPGWDVVEEGTPSSQPRCDFPKLAEPTLGDHSHKKTNPKKTSSKKTRDDAPSARSALDARRASTGSSAREAGGSAASGNSQRFTSQGKPAASARLTREERDLGNAVYALLPEEVRKQVPRGARGLSQAFIQALAPGEPHERTPEQLVEFRVMPRWDRYYASHFYAGTLTKGPIPALHGMLKRDPLCGDARCDEHRNVDSGKLCISCEGKRQNDRGARDAERRGGAGSDTSVPAPSTEDSAAGSSWYPEMPEADAGAPPEWADIPEQRDEEPRWEMPDRPLLNVGCGESPNDEYRRQREAARARKAAAH